MLLVPSPCPCPSCVAFVFWFCSCFQQNNSGTSMGCSALEGLWWDQNSEKPLLGGVSPERTSPWQMLGCWWWQNQCLCGADLPTAVVSLPTTGQATLASHRLVSDFPSCLHALFISSPPALIVSASLCPLEPPGLMLTTGSGRRLSRCMPLVLCRFCK